MNHLRKLLSVVAVCAALVPATMASAQGSDRGMMVMDDGGQRHVLFFSMPDMEKLFTPYFSRADVRLFADELLLSEPQEAIVEGAIDRYTEAFEKLKLEDSPLEGEGMLVMRAGGVDEDEDEPRRPRPRMAAGDDGPDEGAAGPDEEDGGPLGDLAIDQAILDELRAAGMNYNSMDEFPYEPNVGIAITLDQEGDEPPVPSFNVGISFGGADDTMSDEMRATLEQVAENVAKQLTEQMSNQEFAMVGMGGPGFDGEEVDPAQRIADRWASHKGLLERTAKFRKQREALEQKVYEEVKPVLGESQLERWPMFERTLLRAKTLPWGTMDGERVDLVNLLDETEATDALSADGVAMLDTYTVQLHEALKRRNKLMAETDADVDVALYEQRYDRAISMADRLAKAHEKVRNLNDQYREQLAMMLPEEPGAMFRAAALSSGYPRVYRQTLGERVFDEVMEMDGVAEEVRESAAGMATSYGMELRSVNDRLYRVMRDHQAAEPKAELQRMVAQATGEDEPVNEFTSEDDPTNAVFRFQRMDEEIAEGFRTRRNLDVRYMQSLYAMLTPEQKEKLPGIPKIDVAKPVSASGGWDWSGDGAMVSPDHDH